MRIELVFGSNKTFFKVQKECIQINLHSFVLSEKNSLQILDQITFYEESPNKILFGNDELIGGFFIAPLNEKLAVTSLTIYSEILEKSGNYHLCRAWNFIPYINELVNGQLIYGLFNDGRFQAFKNYYGEKPFLPPAATGIDILGDQIAIGFLATKNKVSHLSNPLQTDSFHYPEKYGKRPPTFSRATKTIIGGKSTIFISGTASIRGSESVHPGDILKQTETTIENIQMMIHEANPVEFGETFEAYKMEKIIYVKHPEQCNEILEYIRQNHPEFNDGIVLHANVCRKDLDIEICATLSTKF
jgi:enamine deaminase RidA (YjgF/YER057c/UK114 family)